MQINRNEPGRPILEDNHYRKTPEGLQAMDLMRSRLHEQGGCAQQDRMIKDKNESLKRAVKYSYQAAKIQKVGSEAICPALMNRNKLKQDYDEKILSTGFEFGFEPGDVFKWINTNTYWLITLQENSELAYFKAETRKCNYMIKWINEEDKVVYETYAAVTGPAQKSIQSMNKSASIDIPNHTLEILLPKNKKTLEYFTRYAKFFLTGIDEGDQNTCWKVEAKDSISIPGVLYINAIEYYANEEIDDISESLANGTLVNEPVLFDMGEERGFIEGPDTMKPKMAATFSWKGRKIEEWSWDSTAPIICQVDGRNITVKWTKNYSGAFSLRCGDDEKVITVTSMF